MRVGVVTCRPETSLADVARMMVGYSMHSVVVSDLARPGRMWGIVTSLDLARAAGDLAAARPERWRASIRSRRTPTRR